MFNKPKVTLSAAAVILFTVAALAKDAGPPTIDLQQTCRVTEKAIANVFGDAIANVFQRCIENEEASRQQLIKDWANFSASDKALCMQPKVYQPSYSEWLTCAEMQRDLRALRKNPPPEIFPAAGQAPAARTGSRFQRCPIVQYGPDGGMVSAIACSLH